MGVKMEVCCEYNRYFVPELGGVRTEKVLSVRSLFILFMMAPMKTLNPSFGS